jgi:hypothetical protein
MFAFAGYVPTALICSEQQLTSALV